MKFQEWFDQVLPVCFFPFFPTASLLVSFSLQLLPSRFLPSPLSSSFFTFREEGGVLPQALNKSLLFRFACTNLIGLSWLNIPSQPISLSRRGGLN